MRVGSGLGLLWGQGVVDSSVVFALVFRFYEFELPYFSEVSDVGSAVGLAVDSDYFYYAEVWDGGWEGLGHLYDAGDLQCFFPG